MLAAAANKNRGRKGGKKKLGGKGEMDNASKVTTGPKIRYTEDGFAVTTLYLRGSDVSYLTRNQLLAYFSIFGDMKNVRIHKKPTHSFGFVTFQQAESASKALKVKVHKIGQCKVQVLIADSWHQQQQQSLDHQNGQSCAEKELPVELTNITGTYLLDLNDDCLYEILSLKMLTVMDLCSIAETSVRLKEIAVRVFVTKYKIFNFNSTIDESTTSIHEIRRVFINFGCFISELSIGSSMGCRGISTRIVDLIVRYCTKTLDSLNLIDYEISEHLTVKLKPLFNKLKKLYIKDGTIMGAGKSLFDNCGSLIELKIVGLINCTDDILIFENTFPKLERLVCKEINDLDDTEEVRNFIVRHKNLKTFSVNGFSDDFSSLFPVIADNLKQLEVLQIKGAETYETCEQYSQSVMRLLSLDQLKKLKLNCDGQSTTQFINGLHSLKSLEFLELWHCADSSFIPAISKIKSLNVLRLMDCVNIADLDKLGELDQLMELVIRRPAVTDTFNVINLIKKLINLKTLYLEMDAFKMDQVTYLKIVDIVRKRTVKQPLEITSDAADEYVADIQNDGDNRQIVKFHKFFKWNHSSTDVSIDDYDLDDDDDSWDFDHLAYPFDDDLYFNGYFGCGNFGYGYGSDNDDVDDFDFFPF